MLRIGCIVMAAGNASRFGENKLLATVDGQTMIERTLRAVPAHRLCSVCVVTQYPAVAALARTAGFFVVENHHPAWGISHTIALGLQAMPSLDAALFLVADQPYLQRQSVERLLDVYAQSPAYITAVSHNGRRGNPCLFPARFFPELLALQGDQGGSAVIHAHQDLLRLMEVDALQLRDVDTPQQLSALERQK